MRYIDNRKVVATIVAASCVWLQASSPASANIQGPLKGDSVSAYAPPQDFRTDAAQSGRDVGRSTALPPTYASAAAQSGRDVGRSTALPPTYASDAAQSGRDIGRSTTLPPTYASDAAQSGRDAVASTAAAPTTVEVVRPERTIVRDVDEALPLVLSGTALALVLAALAMTLVYVRILPRAGRSH